MKTNAFLMALFLPFLGADANAQETFGQTALATGGDCCNSGLLLAQSATLAQGGQLQSLSFYVSAPSGSLNLGLYDANGPNGTPGGLIIQSGPFTPVAGWNTVTISSSPLLAAGNYWLAFEPSDNNLGFLSNRTDPGPIAYGSQVFGSMPTAFPANPTLAANGAWSFYGTVLAAAPTPTPTPTPTPAPTPGQVTLAWSPPSTIAGYQLSWGLTNGGPYPNSVNTGLVYQFTLTGLPSGQIIYGVVQSYDANRNPSCDSNQIQATVP